MSGQRDYEVVECTRYGQERYCIVDPDTGEMLDDAQGYGYKTRRNAHVGWAYSRKPKAEKDALKRKEREVESWWAKHKHIGSMVAMFEMDGITDGLSVKDIRAEVRGYLARECLDELPCGLDEFMRTYCRYGGRRSSV